MSDTLERPVSDGEADWDEALRRDPKLSAFKGEDDAGAIICARHGHAAVGRTCFGYVYCDRCGAQVGDTLGGDGGAARDMALIGHDCTTCRASWTKADFWGRFGVSPAGGGVLQETSSEQAARSSAMAKRMEDDPKGVLDEINVELAEGREKRRVAQAEEMEEGKRYVATKTRHEWAAERDDDPEAWDAWVETLSFGRLSALCDLMTE